mmetsp:Transcript_16421/g.34716  ORF Transcript_16421/g.34716 Transcript_16421/m.34716 type:complete len:279 (+) Transcript_16421:857-1693(+)
MSPRRALPVPRMLSVRGIVLLLPPGPKDRRHGQSEGDRGRGLREERRAGMLGVGRGRGGDTQDGEEVFEESIPGERDGELVRAGRERGGGVSSHLGVRGQFGRVVHFHAGVQNERNAGGIHAVLVFGHERADHVSAGGIGLGHPHHLHGHGRGRPNVGTRQSTRQHQISGGSLPHDQNLRSEERKSQSLRQSLRGRSANDAGHFGGYTQGAVDHGNHRSDQSPHVRSASERGRRGVHMGKVRYGREGGYVEGGAGGAAVRGGSYYDSTAEAGRDVRCQ